jgi:molybdopterin-guanine dinucleotide biosynthesis protein A
VADRGLTGILLVGGASRRFGSAKALASFRGETLAERAWRVLAEVCDERIAVGKRADELDLPFPVLDDGATARAPAYGVLAGLRAASRDLCLALPVDCPLVTADALRALANARAVPQTGPLPGAYVRTVVPELERRLARGELSLRGLNPRVLELDEVVLANVNTPDDLARISASDLDLR